MYRFLIFLCFLSLNIRAQDFITIQEIEYGGLILIEIKNFPQESVPKGSTEAMLMYDAERQKFSFVGKKDENNFKIISEIDGTFIYNHAKAFNDIEFTDDKISICSEMPFRATLICNNFKWSGKTFVFESTDESDPSAENVQKGEEFLEKGMIKEAVESFQNVFYPHAYMDDKDVALRLLYKAHEIALTFYKEKEFAKASEIMNSACEYWYFDFKTIEEMDEAMGYNENYSAKKVISILGDYCLFLYKNGDNEKCIEISGKVILLDSASPGPYLQLGDAYYSIGNKEDATNTYKTYKSLMTKNGNESKIPSRVIERLK